MMMNNKYQINEHISELMDGEHHHVYDVIENIMQDDELQDTWKRYHMISDSLRGHLPEYISDGVYDRVRVALHDEDMIMVAVSKTPTKNITSRPLIGFAVAATIAVVALLGLQQNIDEQPPVIATNDSSDIIQTDLAVDDEPASTIDADQYLSNYLMHYYGYHGNSDMRSILPYVRMVSFEP